MIAAPFWTDRRGNARIAVNDTRQIRTFFEACERDIFITFSGGFLWWCPPSDAPIAIAGKVLDAGLLAWLKDRVS